MKPVKKILQKLNGLHYRQEYLCLAKESHMQGLHVYLASDRRIIKDLTNLHLFVGYNPLLFAFYSTDFIPSPQICLLFSQTRLSPNKSYNRNDVLASLELKLITQRHSGDSGIVYYEGCRASHFFISPFYQFISNLNNRLYNNQEGNVFLRSNLYTQVQVAYSVPRIISLITVREDDLFNLFPTDLHGEIGPDYYIISLRHAGKAAAQVAACGKVLLSQMDIHQYKAVYQLGKNHMQPLKTREHFSFGTGSSENFNCPLQEHCNCYHELLLKNSFVHGIHRLFLFKIICRRQQTASPATLSHIHNSYASWRYKNKLPGNYLLR